jgi:hypothetical protein
MISFALGTTPLSEDRPEKQAAAPPLRGRKPRRRNGLRSQPSAPSEPRRGLLVDDLNVGFDPANVRRCPGCGGMVYLWPCLACSSQKAA